MSARIRILLIDDHPVVRTGLRAVLEAESDLELVGEAESGMRAVSLAHRLRPDVVLTDLLLPDMDGVAVTQRVCAELRETRVVILTSMDEEDASVVRAVQAGAMGYVLKSANTAELVQAIRSAAAISSSSAAVFGRCSCRAPASVRALHKNIPLFQK